MKKTSWMLVGGLLLLTSLLVGKIPQASAASELAISGVTPTLGPVGTEITISGTGFGDDSCYDRNDATCELKVYFNDTEVEFGGITKDDEALSWTDGEIHATIPTSLTTGDITIRVNRFDPDGENFNLTAGQTFDLRKLSHSPTITKVYPTNAAVGDLITITGHDFDDDCEGLASLECQHTVHIGNTEISFDVIDDEGTAVSWTDDEIVIKVPQGTATGEVQVYRNEIVNWGEDDASNVTYDISGDEITIFEHEEDVIRAQEISDIENEALALEPGESETDFSSITHALGITLTRDLDKEAQAEALLDEIYGEFDDEVGTLDNSYSFIFFVAYDFGTTSYLGAGERAGVLNSWKTAFHGWDEVSMYQMPINTAEWEDVLKIANGRWPSMKADTTETMAIMTFQNIYHRMPDSNNANDNAAVSIMTYGLRPEPRNVGNENTAIGFFKGIYGGDPTTSAEWDAVRAIAYSGAVR